MFRRDLVPAWSAAAAGIVLAFTIWMTVGEVMALYVLFVTCGLTSILVVIAVTTRSQRSKPISAEASTRVAYPTLADVPVRRAAANPYEDLNLPSYFVGPADPNGPYSMN